MNPGNTYDNRNGDVHNGRRRRNRGSANPERVVVLSSYAGDLINFDINIVGVDAWSAGNPNFSEGLSGVAVVPNADVEKILELEPDLIIGLDKI